jgi:uncharacterized protein (DUF1015 family)
MAEIFPFNAYRYDLDRVKLAEVVTQPYDKITPAMQERYARIPYNLITIEKGKPAAGDSPSDNVYTRAAKALEEWIRSGILLRDPEPGIYAYAQEFTVPGTTDRRQRSGFIALGRVEDYAARVVFRHEETLSGPKADRLELLCHTRTHTGQLFMLYTDEDRRADLLLDGLMRRSAPVEARDEYDVVHRLWPVFDRELIAAIVGAMAGCKLVIADGHHRYETALAYRDKCRAQSGKRDRGAPYEKTMMTFFNTRSEGLLILPTHRVLSNLPEFNPDSFRAGMMPAFEQESYSFTSDAARAVASYRFQRDLTAGGREGQAIGMYTPGQFTLFRLRSDAPLGTLMPDVSPAQRHLDVVLLHRLLLGRGLGITPAAVTAERNITYEREMSAAIATVDDGRAQVCFLLNPVGVEQVAELALAGEVLPQKSTDFYPKLLSGLTLHRLE